jgi:serine/threonine protein kinase/Flp pilus assembly protein TadD
VTHPGETDSSNAANLGSASVHSKLVDQAYDLFCRLRDQGEAVDPDEFCARYPAVQSSLGRLLEAHQYVERHPELVDVGPDASWPVPGDVFAGFHLVRELGRGTFARVFAATEIALDQRPVALKIARHGGQAEAITLSRIVHPNIVPVYSIAQPKDSGFTAVCMPYLGQTTLLAVLDQIHGRRQQARDAAVLLEAVADEAGGAAFYNPPTVLRTGSFEDGVRWLALQLADGLAFLHGKGICHRDLKPSNILVRPDGTPMLLDFNLATDAQRPCLHQGGTPTYMAPEQIRALDSKHASEMLDARSDLFSLGVILYELLTGHHPFGPLPLAVKGWAMVDLLRDRQRRGFRPVRHFRPDVDGDLAAVIEQCLAFDPKERPAGATEIVRVVRRSQAPRARVYRWLRRRRQSVLAACLLAVALGIAGFYVLATRPPAHVRLSQRGQEAWARRDYHAAIANFTEALREAPHQPELWFARGKAHLELASDDEVHFGMASADFDTADRLTPAGLYKAYLGYSLHKQGGRIDPAILRYQQAIHFGYKSAAIYNNLAQLHLDLLEIQKAQANLDEALRLDPSMATAHFNQALSYFQQALRAGQNSPQQKAFLEKGIEHYRRGAERTRPAAHLTLMCAEMCARAAAFNDAWTGPALDYLEDAVNRGVNPRNLALNPGFCTLMAHPRFNAIRERPAPAKGATIVQLIEPLPD